MQARKVGIFAAILASLCCVGPLLLAALGLGSLGISAFIGANHWYFIAGAGAVLALAWYLYFRERRRCETEQCEIVGGKATRITLPLVTFAVLGFFSLNLYTYAGGDIGGSSILPAAYTQTVIPVEGMTCVTCTIPVEKSLKKLEGVQAAKASIAKKSVTVNYDPEQVQIEQLVKAVNSTGYKAQLPN